MAEDDESYCSTTQERLFYERNRSSLSLIRIITIVIYEEFFNIPKVTLKQISRQGGKGGFPESAPEYRSRIAPRCRRPNQEFILQAATIVTGGSGEHPVKITDAMPNRHADVRQHVRSSTRTHKYSEQ